MPERGLQLIDTFPAFEDFWEKVRRLPVDRQIDLWEREHMAPWPELLAKQKESYSNDGFDWRRIARKMVFPFLQERLERMRALRGELLRELPGAWRRTRERLGVRFPVQFVIHVGIGHGNWATSYGGRPACLIGLENAAEMHDGTDGWAQRVVAHEVAHLAHDEWRRRFHVPSPDTDGRTPPLWRLYEEGFATQAEREVCDPEAFALRTGDPRWPSWCEKHRAWLARKFLADVSARRSVRPFFGSWYKVQGQIETGYYLGAEVIREWRRSWSFESCAVVPEDAARHLARKTLRGIASGEIPMRSPLHGPRSKSS